ncbi:MAG TPA: hypothetical protein VHU23_00850 [Rhizomicrobium sp.]|jgi:hypothetical protein|nr:hypothetical protein [Rhizomicrobium sp.]
MPEPDASLRKQLKKDVLTWTALHHLLPVSSLRELFIVLVDEVSGGKLELSELFEESDVAGPARLESWALRQRPVEAPVAVYLQHRLQHFLWRNDAETFAPEKENTGSIRPADVEAAVTLGKADFGTRVEQLRSSQTGDIELLRALVTEGGRRSREGLMSGFASHVCAAIADEAPLIKLAIAKHMADLCADSDSWQEAKALYASACEFATITETGIWHDFVSGMQELLAQSVATATRVVEGADNAFAQLKNVLERATLQTHPVLVVNAGFDALMAQGAMGDLRLYDRRGTLLTPTYNAASYDIDAVIFDLNHGNFHEAQRRCWAILRRQIALGLASETRATKSVFGRVILAELIDKGVQGYDPASFALMLRLLLESGDTSVDRLEWNNDLVAGYVTAQTVASAVEIARRYGGTWPERGFVAVELMRGWLLCISDEKHAVAEDMMRFLAKVAADEPASVMGSQNLGGRSLEALSEIAKSRPEFRASTAQEIEAAIASKLQPEIVWKGRSNALELAGEYIDIFSDDQLRRIIERTLKVLTAIDPAAQFWPIVRPALRFLCAKPSAVLCKADLAMGQRVLATILKFGVQETQSSELIFNLQDFDSSLLGDPQIQATLVPVVEGLRKRVLTVNSSATAGEIQALLLSPIISGEGGVTDALTALKEAMASAATNRPKLALSYGYAPLQMLVNRQQSFADELRVERGTIDFLWKSVLEEVFKLWRYIAKNPALLAPFSIPRRDRADPVLVHNWTFASVIFAESLGKRAEMVDAVKRAAAQDMLRDPIQRALVTGATLDQDVATDEETIASESADVFYDGLGRRLVLLESMDTSIATSLCNTLLQQCLRFGPRGLDASVLVRGSQLGLKGTVSSDLATNYAKRVDESRELRLSLTPLLLTLDIRSP